MLSRAKCSSQHFWRTALHGSSKFLQVLWEEIRPALLQTSFFGCMHTEQTFSIERISARPCAESLQSRPTPCKPMDCSPPGSSVHGILKARILEWVAMPSSGGPPHPRIEPRSLHPFSRGSSHPRNWTRVSCTAGGLFTRWAKKLSSFNLGFFPAMDLITSVTWTSCYIRVK